MLSRSQHSDRCRKRLTAADAKRRRAGSARCAFLIQGAVQPGNAQFEGRISMSPCVRTSASSNSRWDKSASSWDTCASTSISRSSASTWETRASASASFRCPVGSILGDATGQSRCNLAGSTSRSAYAMAISLLQPAHRSQHSKSEVKLKDFPVTVESPRRMADLD